MTSAARLLVYGGGAIGSLFAALLSRAGHEVLLIGRRAHVEAVRTSGLIVEGVTEGVFHPEVATAIPADERPDGVFVTVKTYDVAEAARALATALSRPAPVLLPQNGIGVEEGFLATLGPADRPFASAPIVRGVSSVPVTFLGPGRIRHAGEGELLLGAVTGHCDETSVERFEGWVRSAGLRVRRVNDIQREVWRKLLVNAAINPVSADHRVPNGQLAEDPWRGQALRLLSEALAVARAEGFEFSREEAEADLFRVVRATAQNRSSMLQDVERGRPTEIDAISGAIVERARRHSIPVPATERALHRIKAKSAAGLPQGS